MGLQAAHDMGVLQESLKERRLNNAILCVCVVYNPVFSILSTVRVKHLTANPVADSGTTLLG